MTPDRRRPGPERAGRKPEPGHARAAQPHLGGGPAGLLLHLQRAAGNRAVTALIGRPAAAVQRQDPPAADGGQQQTMQLVTIETDRGTRKDLTTAQAIAFLSDKTDWTGNRVELMAGDHAALKQVHDDKFNRVAAWFSDVFAGFATMPDPAIWEAPRAAVARVRAALAAGDPVAAGTALQEADRAYQEARETYLTYKESHFEGADTTIAVLKAVIVVDAAVGAALTGGAAAGSGLLGEAGAAGAVGAEGAALKDAGDQVAVGRPFNWTELAEQTAGGFASGFLGALVSGPLKEMLAESCSGYVTEELMSDAEIDEIARALGKDSLERTFLQSELEKFVIDQVADKAGEWLAGKPIEVVTDELKKAGAEGQPPPEEHEAVSRVAELAAPVIAAGFKRFLHVE